MPFYDGSLLNSPTSIFGLHLWVVIGILSGSIVVLFLFLLSLCLFSRWRNRRPPRLSVSGAEFDPTPVISKDIHEIVVPTPNNQRHLPINLPEIQIDMGKVEHKVVFTDKTSSGDGLRSGEVGGVEAAAAEYGGPEVSHLGWGRWFTLRELELATNGLADENVIGEGGYGILYSGVLRDNTNTRVAVKNLLNNRGQAENEFRVEVEAIGRVQHKNLVRLLGYCIEGAYRMLVYEYVDNGNLDQWLHGEVGGVSSLTWDTRLNIVLETAKGLAYLHEGLEPKVVHRDIKSSNVLLNREWNAKLSDFGLAKLLCTDRSYVTTRVMGTFGYVAPEYACTGMLTEKSDVYSFGILIMEVISGRAPVDYTRPPGEVKLVDWLKTMVSNRRSEEIVDPKLAVKPSSKALKQVLLVALRCVDPEAQKRPKMGHVIHMLEANELFSHSERQIRREFCSPNQEHSEESCQADRSESESSACHRQQGRLLGSCRFDEQQEQAMKLNN
ncbi:hypothetical protein V2J09_013969 [Rumex salicifolius]